jgi:chromosome segregation ATPase
LFDEIVKTSIVMVLQSRFHRTASGFSSASRRARRLRGYNHLTASRQFHREDSIATQKDLRRRLEELASHLDQVSPAKGFGSRAIETILSSFRRTRIDPLAEILRSTVELLMEYDNALTEISGTIDSNSKQTNATANDVTSLRGDSQRTMEHLAALQDDYSKVREHLAALQEGSNGVRNDHAQMVEHLAALQEGHDGVRNDHAQIVERLAALQKNNDAAREHLAALQEDHDGARGESTRITEHLAALQKDHDKVREHLSALQEDQAGLHLSVSGLGEGSDSHGDSLQRLDDLWADLHRDMTTMAEALSRRKDG